jgi:hypothetical protein
MGFILGPLLGSADSCRFWSFEITIVSYKISSVLLSVLDMELRYFADYCDRGLSEWQCFFVSTKAK